MKYRDYLDRVLACYTGKSIGGTLGAAWECKKQWVEIDDLGAEWPEKLPPNDDLDIQVAFLEAMEDRGVFITSADLVDYWRDRCWYDFAEYGTFLLNVQRGIMPPLSGEWNNDFFHSSEGCPIRAEIWGLVSPGNPELAAAFAGQDGVLDHAPGVSVELEQFYAAATAAALGGADMMRALETGAASLPEKSRTREVWDYLKKTHDESGLSDKQLWRRLIRNFGSRDSTNALTNFAIALFAFYRCGSDFKRMIRLCLQSGWDTDCTAATMGALWGSVHGMKGLPADYVEKMGKNLCCGIAVRHRNATLLDLSEDTAKIGVEMSKLRNFAVTIEDAPAVPVRPRAARRFSASVRYLSEPCLYRDRAAKLEIEIANLSGGIAVLPLQLAAPGYAECGPFPSRVELGPDECCTVTLFLRLKEGVVRLPDRNIFTFFYGDEKLEFGLGGSRSYRVYGPYWDMWDVKKYPECPYHNDKVKTVAPVTGNIGDVYDQYAYLSSEYLDEETLLREDLPEEDFFVLETPFDRIRKNDLGSFDGGRCFYLVREFVFTGDLDKEYYLLLGRSCAAKVWLDGEELGAFEGEVGYSPMSEDFLTRHLRFTGKKQRLVVKCAPRSDDFSLSLTFIDHAELHPRDNGVSWFLDAIDDVLG